MEFKPTFVRASGAPATNRKTDAAKAPLSETGSDWRIQAGSTLKMYDNQFSRLRKDRASLASAYNSIRRSEITHLVTTRLGQNYDTDRRSQFWNLIQEFDQGDGPFAPNKGRARHFKGMGIDELAGLLNEPQISWRERLRRSLNRRIAKRFSRSRKIATRRWLTQKS